MAGLPGLAVVDVHSPAEVYVYLCVSLVALHVIYVGHGCSGGKTASTCETPIMLSMLCAYYMRWLLEYMYM